MNLAYLVPLALAAATVAQTEVRGTWIARDGLTSRQKIQSTLDQLKAANCNLVCVDVWTRGYTIHPSDVMQQTCGVAQDPDPTYSGRDPLAEVLFEAHLRGMEVEAWFEYGFCFGWSGWYAGASGVGPVLASKPSWKALDQNGNSQVSDGGSGFFTWAAHENPAVRQFLIDLVVEVVDRYDVDGVQLDRVRYPSTAFGYDAATSLAYQQATGSPPPTNANLASWKRWRADGLIAFHQQLYAAVKARRGSVRVTNAPVTMTLAYDSFLQDWPEWVKTGAVDLIYPQVYRTSVSSYVTSLDQQLNYLTTAERQKVAPGVRAISGTSTASVLGMVAANRQRNLPGQVFWYAEGLYDDLPQLTASYFQTPAAMPDRPPLWRPQTTVVEENDPSTTATPGFLPSSIGGASGGAALLALPFAAASENVTYTLQAPEAGLYSLQAYVSPAAGLSTQAPVTFTHAGGTAALTVDQSSGAQGWRELGTFWVDPGTTTCVLNAVPGEAVVADAFVLLRSRFPSGAMGTWGANNGGSQGGLLVSMSGQSRVGGALTVGASRAPAGALAAIGFGLSPAFVPLFGGTLYLTPVELFAGWTDARGTFTRTLPVPNVAAAVGLAVWSQALAFDPGTSQGVALSQGVAGTIAGNQ